MALDSVISITFCVRTVSKENTSDLNLSKNLSVLQKKAMIDDPKAEFQLFDVNSGALPTGFDYGFVSGMFNIRHDGNEFMMYDTLTRLWDVCEKGIAFNVLSTFVEYYDDNLYYVDPSKMFSFPKTRT